MRSILLILLVFVGLWPTHAVQAQTGDCVVIHVYRPNNALYALTIASIYVNDEKVADLANNSRFEFHLPNPGSYRVSMIYGLRGEQYRKRTEKAVTLNCGQASHFRINSGSLYAEGVLSVEHPAEAQGELSRIPPDKATVWVYQNGMWRNSKADAGYIEPVAHTTTPTPKPVQQTTPPPQQTNTGQPTRTTGGSTSASSATSLKVGRSYALIIGVNTYSDYRINDLDQPIADAQKLFNVLIAQYTFNQADVKFLKNPTKDEITQELDRYFEKLSANDHLLIFYAGHGYWDEKFQQGYWLPSDAQKSNRGTWLSNGTIRDYMRAIPTRHSLLITDACFGGGIFKSRSAFSNSSMAINQLYKLPSRKAMTSGAMSEVPDKSVFIEYLVKRLQQNEEKYLSSEQLFASFKIAVINNSANGQVPQFGEVKETGDEGGDFIFIKK